MKKLIVMTGLLVISFPTYALKINGQFISSECNTDKSMLWLSKGNDNYKDRKLLLHTLVPKNGTFSFYVKPGEYQVRASDEKGCEYSTKIKISESDKNLKIALREE